MLSYLAILFRKRRVLVAGTLGVALLSAVVSLLLPKWYVARTSILPPENIPGGFDMMAIIQGMNLPFLPGSALLGSGGSNYESILKSRRLREELVEDFDLQGYFKVRRKEAALGKLLSQTSTSVGEDGLLVLTYRDRDPEMAARIANRYSELLDHFNRELTSTRSGKTREFLERQVALRMETMAVAEESLRVFQEEHGAIELSEQVTASISLGADLIAARSSLEVELRLLEQYVKPDSPLYRWKLAQFEEADRQLNRLRVTDDREDLFLSMEEIPRLALRYARLLRQVRIEQAIYQLLVEQYETSRIEEVRDTPTIQVLDTASVPDRHALPRRKWIVAISTLAGFGVLSIGLIVRERYRQRSFDPAVLDSLDAIVSGLRSDLDRVRRRPGSPEGR